MTTPGSTRWRRRSAGPIRMIVIVISSSSSIGLLLWLLGIMMRRMPRMRMRRHHVQGRSRRHVHGNDGPGRNARWHHDLDGISRWRIDDHLSSRQEHGRDTYLNGDKSRRRAVGIGVIGVMMVMRMMWRCGAAAVGWLLLQLLQLLRWQQIGGRRYRGSIRRGWFGR